MGELGIYSPGFPTGGSITHVKVSAPVRRLALSAVTAPLLAPSGLEWSWSLIITSPGTLHYFYPCGFLHHFVSY